MGKFSNPFVERDWRKQNPQDATLILNGLMWEVWADGEVQFTHQDKTECAFFANENGYTIK